MSPFPNTSTSTSLACAWRSLDGTTFWSAALLALVLISLAACTAAPTVRPTAEPVKPNAEPDRASQELDILEAVFRYQFEHNASSATTQHLVECLFLSLDKDQDPPAELLARFKGHTPPVESVSAVAPNRWHGVRHKLDGRRGIIVLIKDIRWIDADTVEVDGGYYEAGRSASENVYRADRRNGPWTVVSDKLISIT